MSPRHRWFSYDPANIALAVGGHLGEGRDDTTEVPRFMQGRTLLAEAAARWRAEQAPPTDETEALMQAAPGDTPRESLDQREVRLEPVREAIDSLCERERYVIEALFYRGMSLRDLGLEMAISKTHVARLRDAAKFNIAQYLGGEMYSHHASIDRVDDAKHLDPIILMGESPL